jgi:hypothetical protein
MYSVSRKGAANMPINRRRVIVGGLVTGLLLNMGEAALHAGVLSSASRAMYAALGRTEPADPMYLVWLVALTFAQGIAALWLYAAIRPRFGPGPKTALCAGLAVWFFSAVYAAVYIYAGFPGLVPGTLVWTPVVWGLVQFPLATLAGAALYRE